MANERIEFIRSGMARFPERDPGAPRFGSKAGTPRGTQRELRDGRSRPGTLPFTRDPGEAAPREGPGYGGSQLLEQDSDDIRCIDLSRTRPSSVDASCGNRSMGIPRLSRLWGRSVAARHGQARGRRGRAGHRRSPEVRLYARARVARRQCSSVRDAPRGIRTSPAPRSPGTPRWPSSISWVSSLRISKYS